MPAPVVLPGLAIALATGVMLAVGTNEDAWLAPPSFARAHDALLACALAGAAIASALWCVKGVTPATVAVGWCAALLLGAAHGTNDALAWRACLDAAGVAHPEARSMILIEGTVLTAPQAARRADPLMEPLAHERTAVRFVLGRLATASPTDASAPTPWPSGAQLLVRLAVGSSPLAIGDRIAVRGWVTPMRPASNPGGYDMSRWGRSRWVVASMFVESTALIERVGSDPQPLACWRNHLVRRLTHVLRDAPADASALGVAMTLGPTSAPMDAIAADCQVTGMTHVIALSGFNVGLLLAMAGRALAATPLRGVARGAVLAACAVLFIISATAGFSADRAGVAALVVAVAGGSGYRVRVWSAAGIVVICMVVLTPAAVLDIGFQLSVVVALVLASWGWRTQAVAFLASTPIVLHHFGAFTPLVVPGSLVAAPMSAVVVTLCTLALIVDGVVPVVGAAAGALITVPATWAASAFAWFADALASLHWASWSVDPIPGWVCVGTLASLAAALHLRKPWWLLVWLVAFCWWAWPARFDLRVTMLDVANGSAWVVEHQGAAALIDAGSLDVPDVGARTVVPALRALGITRLDAVSLSHADLDHLNALPEVFTRLPVKRFLTTAMVVQGACDGTPSARVLDAAASQGCVPEAIEAMDLVWLGESPWHALHPLPGAPPFPRNESSLSWLVGDHRGQLLLCGDIEEGGSLRVLRALGSARQGSAPLLMELPHHGSFRPGVAKLIEAACPQWIGQSTGPARLVRDRWAWLDRTVARHATARDGAVRVTIMDGSVTVERWSGGWRPIRRE